MAYSNFKGRFAPLDIPDPVTVDLIMKLIKGYDIPPAFVTARLQAVVQAYGSRGYDNGRFGKTYI
jgi:hypothetical protein